MNCVLPARRHARRCVGRAQPAKAVEHLANEQRHPLTHRIGAQNKRAPRDDDTRDRAHREHRVGAAQLAHLLGGVCGKLIPPAEHAEGARVLYTTQHHAKLEYALVRGAKGREASRGLKMQRTPHKVGGARHGRIHDRVSLAPVADPAHPAARELA